MLSIDERNVSITASFVGLLFERENGSTRAMSERGFLEASIVCNAWSFKLVILVERSSSDDL